MKTFKELIESRDPLLKPNFTSGVLRDTDLIKLIGKTRARAIWNHPFYKKYVGEYGYPHVAVFKVSTNQYGSIKVSAASSFKFKSSKGDVVRKMVQFDLYKYSVTNAHVFENLNDNRHPEEYGGGPVWNWSHSDKSDED
jgi:hypothetical protein